jgi:hypothetical protein
MMLLCHWLARSDVGHCLIGLALYTSAVKLMQRAELLRAAAKGLINSGLGIPLFWADQIAQIPN